MIIYEIFPRLGEIYFGELLGGKFFREANTQERLHKLEENGSVLLYLNISGLDSRFMFDGGSVTIRYSKTT